MEAQTIPGDQLELANRVARLADPLTCSVLTLILRLAIQVTEGQPVELIESASPEGLSQALREKGLPLPCRQAMFAVLELGSLR